MNQDLARMWAEIVKAVLTGEELVRVEAPAYSWPETRIGQRLEKVQVMEWGMNATLSITDTTGTVCNLSELHIDPDRRTIHAKHATEDYGVIRVSWTLMHRSSETFEIMLDAEATVKTALTKLPPAGPVKEQEKEDGRDLVLRRRE